METVEVLLPELPEAIAGGEDHRQHHKPNPHGRHQGRPGRPQLLGFEGVTDSQPAVHGDAQDGVDASVYSHKIQAFQDGAERLEASWPGVAGGVHFEGKEEEEEEVHQSQAAHVNDGLCPFSQENAERDERHGVQDQAAEKNGDVDDQLQILHQVVHRFKGAVARHDGGGGRSLNGGEFLNQKFMFLHEPSFTETSEERASLSHISQVCGFTAWELCGC